MLINCQMWTAYPQTHILLKAGLSLFNMTNFSMSSCSHFNNFLSDPIRKQSTMSKRGKKRLPVKVHRWRNRRQWRRSRKPWIWCCTTRWVRGRTLRKIWEIQSIWWRPMKNEAVRPAPGNRCGQTKAKIQSNILKWGNRKTLNMQTLGNKETGMNLRTRLARKNWCWRWTQRQSFTTWWSQITNTWRRFSNFRKRNWESLQVAQHLQWKQWRPMFWYGVVHVFVNESRHSSWHELIGDLEGLQEYELRGNSELIQYHTETDIGAFWRNCECEHDWKYISLMDEIDIVSWSSDPLNKAKVRVFSDSAVSGEDVISKRSSCKMGRSSGVNLDVRFFWELLGIDEEAIESEWNVFSRICIIADFSEDPK